MRGGSGGKMFYVRLFTRSKRGVHVWGFWIVLMCVPENFRLEEMALLPSLFASLLATTFCILIVKLNLKRQRKCLL